MNNNSQYDKTLDELVKSFAYMVESLKTSTKIYDGIVISNNNDGRWNIKYNGEIHPVKPYGTVLPSVDSIVKVIIPQGNQALSWFFINEGGGTGDGTTFIPSVSEEGIISWTNDGGLPNPEPVNIKGPQGDTGSQGPTGPQGSTGPYFTPSVDESGNLSWSNNGGLNNPTTVSIKGPQGEQGEQGIQGNVGPQGPQGLQGNPGYYFTPSVDAEGNLSWTNNGDLTNPSTVNIKGPQGIQGEQGPQGVQGEIGDTGPQGPKGDTGPYFTPNVSSNGDLSWTNNGNLDNPTTVNIKGPQGEQGAQGVQGNTGPYFTPSLDSDGNLSWTNNGDLNNPVTVNIKGPQGIQGPQGEIGAIGPQGPQGDTGPYFTPSVSSSGDLSWTNNGDLQNPTTVNIKGPQGEQGEQGATGPQGPKGDIGPYFAPSVDSSGNLSWTNNGGLDNPATVNIKGPQGLQGPQGEQGEMGPQGQTGAQGETGPYFTPSVSSEGVISWTNNGGLSNPSSVNIKGPQGATGPQGEQGATGPQGDTGPQGPAGANGADATINGVNALTLTTTGGLTGTQSGNTYTIDGSAYALNTGDTLSGTYLYKGNAADGPIRVRGIWGLLGTNPNDLYLQYRNSGTSGKVRIGSSSQLVIDEKGNLSTTGSLKAQGINIITALNTKLTTPSGTQGQVLGYTADNVVGAINPPSSSSMYNTTYTGVLQSGSSAWTSSSGMYYQQFSLDTITSTQTPLVFPQWTTNKSNEQTSWNMLTDIQSFDGYIRFYANRPTTTNVDFIIVYSN